MKAFAIARDDCRGGGDKEKKMPVRVKTVSSLANMTMPSALLFKYFQAGVDTGSVTTVVRVCFLKTRAE